MTRHLADSLGVVTPTRRETLYGGILGGLIRLQYQLNLQVGGGEMVHQ